jgi:hypothetical protein
MYGQAVRDIPSEPTKGTGLFVLKPANGNDKVGGGKGVIGKGPFKGTKLYTLTLEERATCPATCRYYSGKGKGRACYGDNMPFALRYRHGPALVRAIRRDLDTLDAKGAPYTVRLHILGDFYSVAYVRMWAAEVAARPLLHIYGYTHRTPGSAIGAAVGEFTRGSDRVAILRSDGTKASRGMPIAVSLPVRKTDAAKDAGVLGAARDTARESGAVVCNHH